MPRQNAKLKELWNKPKVARKQKLQRSAKATSKRFNSYINERRIVRDKVGPLKTPDGIVVTTDNDMANALNDYFSSVFKHEQLNNIPQLDQYEANTIDIFNFRANEVQQK